MQTSSKEGKKVLLRVSNLKQYFPLKKKGLFVKANDGITLDIYEGETFGLVGESGCGKSTLGRTLLQLYRQTDGRTMYYGRTLDDLAPAYVKKTLQTLDKRREKWHELKKHLANVQKEYGILTGIVNGFATALGFTIAIVILAGIREKIEYNDIPESFKGMPTVLLTAGLMAIAFCGFSGLL